MTIRAVRLDAPLRLDGGLDEGRRPTDDQRRSAPALGLHRGSERFVVYGDGRNTRGRGVPALVNRTLAVEATRLFRF